MVDLYSLVFVSFAQAFYKYTAAVETLGIIVALMISYYGYKAYKLTNQRKHRYFFYGFLFLGVNFFAHVLLNLMLRLGFARWFVEQKYTIYIWPLFGIYYFFLIGLLLAYISFAILYLQIKNKRDIRLFYMWGFVIGAFSFTEYLVFNVLAAVPLSFIVLHLYDKYKSNKRRQTNQLFTLLAFVSLFLFHILVLLEPLTNIFFTIRYTVLLIGLLFLLVTFLRIFYGRTKK